MVKTAWLIEKQTISGARWLTIHPTTESKIQGVEVITTWGGVAHYALKFADKDSADAYIKFHSPAEGCFASQHSFHSA